MKQKLPYIILLLVFSYLKVEAQKSSCVFPKNNTYTKVTSQVFTVNQIPTAINYRIQISSTINFSVIVKDTITSSTSLNYHFPNTNQKYYWRTKAYIPGDSTDWSSTFMLFIFSPKNVPNVLMWLSAQNISLANNSRIADWSDSSNNHYDATQSTLSLQPTYKSSGGIRNKPYVDFNTNSLHTAINNTLIPNDSTLGFVSLNMNRPEGYGALFYLGNTASFPVNYAGRTGGSSYNNGSFRYLGYDGTLFSFDMKTPNANYKIMSGYDNNKIAKLFSTSNEVASGIAYPIGVASGATLKIGSNQDAGENYNGSVHEFILLRNTTDTTIFRNIEKFIDCDYIPRANLGGNIYKPYGFCDSTITLNPGAGYASYLWSTGATSPTILITQFGTYSVTVTDELGYTHSDAMNYLPNIYLRYPATTKLCANDSLVWDSKIPSIYTVKWSDGKVGPINSIKTIGKYYFTVQDINLCTYTSDTINVTLDSFPIIASLGPDTNLCAGNPIYLKTGASQAVTYLWSNGSTNNSLAIFTTGPYSVIATSISGCIKKDTINILSILGQAPTPNFSLTTTCFGSATQFTDSSNPPGSDHIISWNWDFGDLTTPSGVTSPSHTYADTGAYTAKLTVTTNIGCSAELSKTFIVYLYPKGSFTVANLCERDSVYFSALATTYGYPITQWNWNFAEPSSGANNISSSKNPFHIYANAATYSVSLTIQNAAGCADTIINSTIIKPSPIVNFNHSLLCEKQLIQFTDNTTLPSSMTIQSSIWNFGDNTALTSSLNPTHTYSVSATYNIVHKITGSNGCNNTNTTIITVNPKPRALYSVGNACVSLPTIFSDTSLISGGTIAHTLWNYGNGHTSSLKSDPHIFTAATNNAQVKLVVTSDSGCVDSITKTIIVHPTPVANFTCTPSYGNPPLAVTFTSTGTSAFTYAWNFNDLTIDSVANPIHTFTDTGTYHVSLITSNSFGCSDTAAIQTISVLKYLLDIAVRNVTTVIQNNFMSVSAQIFNKGTVDVTSLEITVAVNNGAVIKENWTGLLVRGGVIQDTINSTIYMKDLKHFLCVSAIQPNNLNDEFPSDNESCVSIDNSSFEVLEPYPNPAEDFITLPLLIPANKNLDVTIYNARGKSLGAVYSGIITEGLQLITVDLVGLAKGFYTFYIVYDGQTLVKKFIID